jgi:paraquat-inducible protein A
VRMDPMADARARPAGLTARAAGLVACPTCGRVSPAGTTACARCGSMLHSRKPMSLQRVWAWLIVGLICYIPANIYPMMEVVQLGSRTEATIVEGVIDLAEHGAWDLALIVGTASVLIPVSKFLVIAYIALGLQFRLRMPAKARIHLYHIVEFIGRWSMIDVFVVAILAALVQLGIIATIRPGPAAAFFALSVAFTMLAAQAMDPRLIWDAADRNAAADV